MPQRRVLVFAPTRILLKRGDYGIYLSARVEARWFSETQRSVHEAGTTACPKHPATQHIATAAGTPGRRIILYDSSKKQTL